MIYDPETLEADLLTLVQANLPAKLAAITAEKADSVALPAPKPSEYFNTTDDRVDNRKLAVQYGLIDGAPVPIGSNTAEDNRYIFLVYVNEQNKKPGVLRKKLFRYIRALVEVFNENFDRLPCAALLKVRTIAPTSASWMENETSPVYKVGGVYIETSIG